MRMEHPKDVKLDISIPPTESAWHFSNTVTYCLKWVRIHVLSLLMFLGAFAPC